MVAPNAGTANVNTFHGLAVGADTIVLGTGVPDASGGVARRMFVC